MMKMVMKIDKSQIKTFEKVTDGQGGTFRTTPAIQAGYKNISIMCIGGSGGYVASATNGYYGAGGGGGGSAMLTSALSAISESCPYYAGRKGADSGVATLDADNGQSSYFSGMSAYGGGGATGIKPGWGNSDVYASIGGQGGGNNFGVGGGGAGGHAPFTYGGLGYGGAAPTNGIWTDLGGGSGGGVGGGGGAGRSTRSGYTGNSTNGSYGSVSVAQAPPAGWLGGDYGGQGGGADLFPLTGTHEIYGTYGPGVVAFKIS